MDNRLIYICLFKITHYKLIFKFQEQFSNFVIGTQIFSVKMHKLSDRTSLTGSCMVPFTWYASTPILTLYQHPQ
jgi:hypothetical protein